MAILLDAGRAQAGKAMVADRGLPGQEFFNGQGIAFTGFFQAQQSATHGGDDFCLSADDPNGAYWPEEDQQLSKGCHRVR